MKKLVVASVLALAVCMASQQTASAWHDIKFSAGITFSATGGGNNFLWGFAKGATYPGADAPPGFLGHGGYGDYSGAAAAPAWQAPAPAPEHKAPAVPAGGGSGVQPSYFPSYSTGYQPVGYYYYPGYYPSQVPAYWYGR